MQGTTFCCVGQQFVKKIQGFKPHVNNSYLMHYSQNEKNGSLHSVGVVCMRSHSQILLGSPYFAQNVKLITKVKKKLKSVMNSLIVLLFCLSDEDLKKKFFGFEKKSLIDRISCFSINMAHVILNPYQKKNLSTIFFFAKVPKK